MGTAIRQVIARVYNNIDKLKYNIDDLDIRYVARESHTVERLIEPKSDMAGIIAQLSHLALTTRYHVIKMAQYIGESKEWLIGNDWKFVNRKTKYIIKTLLGLLMVQTKTNLPGRRFCQGS